MDSLKKTWRKLAVRFNTEGRRGSAELAKADYVAYEQFAPTAESMDGPPQAYFCSSCEYFKAVEEGNQFGGICKKFKNAEVEPYGCCNSWSIIPEMDDSQDKFK